MNAVTTTAPCCPTCGQALAQERLIIDLNANCVAMGGVRVHLAPREAEILSVLQAHYPKFVRDEYLEACVVGIDEDSKSRSWASIYIFKLRKKLQPFGVKINNQFGVGYQLEMPQ